MMWENYQPRKTWWSKCIFPSKKYIYTVRKVQLLEVLCTREHIYCNNYSVYTVITIFPSKKYIYTVTGSTL